MGRKSFELLKPKPLLKTKEKWNLTQEDLNMAKKEKPKGRKRISSYSNTKQRHNDKTRKSKNR